MKVPGVRNHTEGLLATNNLVSFPIMLPNPQRSLDDGLVLLHRDVVHTLKQGALVRGGSAGWSCGRNGQGEMQTEKL